MPTTREDLGRRVRAMYNAHPFPHRREVPQSLSDERFRTIYRDFLRIPFESFRSEMVLDAGCGTGENTASWRRLLDPGVRLVGIDLSAASVRIARANAPSTLEQSTFAVHSLLDLGLATHSVDLVFCSGVLVAVPDPHRAFRELVRVLKPGGYMILVLYSRYGRAIHAARRAVVGLVERNDVDRRARLGGLLFGGSMRHMAERENVSFEDILYDQFGLPCESRYSVGQILKWFQEAGIEYQGTWPPIEWAQFGKALRFSYFLARYRKTLPMRCLLRLFPDGDTAPARVPRFLDRASVQSLWALNQLQLFAIAGRKCIDIPAPRKSE